LLLPNSSICAKSCDLTLPSYVKTIWRSSRQLSGSQDRPLKPDRPPLVVVPAIPCCTSSSVSESSASIVDSSFVPLPIPGVTDIMLIVMSARHENVLLLVLLATAGSAVGGWFSHQVGQRGGMAFLQKHVPARIFKPVCDWMESHAILSVALPAILPPPMPLSPFVLAAGALNMPRRKFMIAFTTSRLARHAIAAWLGVHYGRHILRLWNSLSAKYATSILIVIWVGIAISCAYAFWKLYKTSRTIGSHQQPSKTPA
jgi:membrane protein YqaA with SNARE-associated domain